MNAEDIASKVSRYLGVCPVEVRAVSCGVLLRLSPGNPTLIATEDGRGKLHVYSFPHNVPAARLCGVISRGILAQREEIAVL